MENSPLKFLDYDMAIMLGEQVRLSQEEEARRYHIDQYIFKKKNMKNYSYLYLSVDPDMANLYDGDVDLIRKGVKESSRPYLSNICVVNTLRYEIIVDVFHSIYQDILHNPKYLIDDEKYYGKTWLELSINERNSVYEYNRYSNIDREYYFIRSMWRGE